MLKTYFGMFSTVPKYYKNVLPLSKSDNAASYNINGFLPYRDKFGRRVYVYRGGKWFPNKVSYDELYSLGYKFIELMSMEPKTQVAGVTMIVDGEGYGMKQFTGVSMTDMKYGLTFMEV